MGGRVSRESPPPNSPIPDDPQKPDKADPTKETGEEEEEEECGFCVFMKGGGCKDVFIDWQNCVEEEEKRGGDLKQCGGKVDLLFECMDVHNDYYGAASRAYEKEKGAAGETENSKKESSVTPESEKKDVNAPESEKKDVNATESEKVSRDDSRS